MIWRWRFWLFLFPLAITSAAHGHDVQPGYLDINWLNEDRYEVVWRAPLDAGSFEQVRLRLPESWRDTGETPPESNLAIIDVHRVYATGEQGLEGCTIRFPGLDSTRADVFVKITPGDGPIVTAFASPIKTYVELNQRQSRIEAARDYFSLGYQHILLGLDHLLFVLGLLLIVKCRMMLLKTITAFTIAHSLTLAIVTLGFASIPLPPLNAAIALSILFLGPEIVRSWRGHDSFTLRNPWFVAFLFGLLHGFGFASGLSAVGMPGADLAVALLSFNVGVEAGQLAFVLVVLLTLHAFRTLELCWPLVIARAPGYAVGICGAFWTIQRCLLLFSGG